MRTQPSTLARTNTRAAGRPVPCSRVLGAVLAIVVVAAGCNTQNLSSPGTTAKRGDASAAAPGTAAPAVLWVRRDAATLSAAERKKFVDAVRKLQTTASALDPRMSWYDEFVQWHNDAFACQLARGPVGAAHNSPLFLPWHREYLLRFEDALRQVTGDPTINLPYWNWTSDASRAAVFSNDLMGPEGDPTQGYAVTSGPFARGTYQLDILDPLEVQDDLAPQTNYLVRRFGAFPAGTQDLPTAAEVDGALAVGSFDVAGWDAQADPAESFRNNLEGWREAKPPDCSDGWQGVSEQAGAPHVLHNGVHVWVGGLWQDAAGMHAGTMLYNTSPNDPVFWLHHANIDRLWSEWEARHGEQFPTDAAGYRSASTMWPWHDRTIGSLQSTETLGYRYE